MPYHRTGYQREILRWDDSGAYAGSVRKDGRVVYQRTRGEDGIRRYAVPLSREISLLPGPTDKRIICHNWRTAKKVLQLTRGAKVRWSSSGRLDIYINDLEVQDA